MQLPWKALAEKAWTWLRPRIVAEIETEVAKHIERRAVPSRTTIAAPVPFVPDQPPSGQRAR